MGATGNSRAISVLILDGESEFALFVAHCLAQFPQVRLHVLAGERWAPIRFSRYCRSYTFRQYGAGDESRLEAVEEVVKKHKVDVVLPTETEWISFVVAHREALSSFVAVVPVPDPGTFQVANDKWRLAQFLVERGIPCPPTVLVTCDEAFDRRLQDMDFPVLLKPAVAWGGEGIERFESLPELRQYLEQRDVEQMRGQFIVQSFLSGFVVGVNVLASRGQMLASTIQRGIIPNTHKYAAAGAIQFIKDDRFAEAAQRLVSALAWSGFANIDTLYDDRDHQLKILEINARFWGSLRGSLIAGVSFPYLACLAALDIPFPMPDYELVRYVHPKTAVREGLSRLVGRSRDRQAVAFAFRDTGLQFMLADPLAEGLRAYRQEVADKTDVV
jgi:predicted ATP-grasp superfamily ATP-dependent carboligase